MMSQAAEIANRMKSMSDTEIEYLLGFLRRRHAEALLGVIDLKLEESKGTASLSEAEVSAKLAKGMVILMQTQLQEITRDARFDVRVPQALKEAVTYAAKLQGLDLSDFIIAAIANEAGRVINENHVIHLTLRDQRALLEALNAPAKEPTAKARAAAAKYKKNVENGQVVIQH